MVSRRQVLQGSLVMLWSARSGAQASSYSIGTLFPMSDSTAELGSIFMQATQLAIAHIKEDKLVSQPIQIKAQDSHATSQGGAVGTFWLTSVARIPYVLVAVTGASKAAAAAAIGPRSQVVMVNGGGVSPDLAELSPYFRNVIPLADQGVPTDIAWMQRQKLSRVAYIYVDDTLGQSILIQLQPGAAKSRWSPEVAPFELLDLVFESASLRNRH